MKITVTPSLLLGMLIVAYVLLAPGKAVMASTELQPLDFTQVEQEWLADHPKIRIGIMEAWPPMDYVDSKGRPQGIGTEFIAALNQRLGNRLEIVPGPWKETYEAVKGKRLDALMDITPKPDREEFFHFTEPYVTVPHAIFARKGEGKLNTLADLKGKTVGVERGFFIVKVLRDNYPGVKVREYDSTADALDALAKGESDAYIGNRAVAMYIIETELISNVQQYGKISETVSVNAIGVRKDGPILRDILQKALGDISPEEKHAILRQWVELPSTFHYPVLNAQEQQWLDARDEIRVAAMDAWPPFNFVTSDGLPAGIGSDLVAALNQRLGSKLKIVSGPWKEVYAKVKERKLDAIMDISPKPAREEFFNFTTPYLDIPHVIVASVDAPYLENEDSLKDKILALEKGFGNVRYFKQNYPEVTIKEYRDTAHALDAVSRGEADAYAGNRGVALYIMTNELITNLRIHGRLRKSGSILALGTRKDWPILREILQKALDDITYEEMRVILSKWVSPEKQPTAELALTASEKQWLGEHPVIRVSNEPDWPPYDFTIADHPTGFAIDYMRLLSSKLGVEFEFVTANWTELMERFKRHEIDVIHPMHYSKEREAFLHYTKPFFTLSSVAAVRRDDEHITTLTQLYGKTLASGEGWTMTRYIQQNHPQIKLLIVKNTLEGLKAVQFGHADAWIDAYATNRYHIDTYQLSNLKLGGEIEDAGDFRFVPHYIGVRKDWPILRDIMQKALDAVSAEEMLQLNRKWRIFAEKVERLQLTPGEQEWLTSNPVLRLGYDIDWPPVEFVDEEGVYKGMSADYMSLIADSLGVELKPAAPQSWQATIDAARKGDLDILSAVARTPQRDVYMNFTNPYLSFPIVIVTARDVAYVSGMEGIAGKAVTVVSGYASHDILVNNHPEITIKPVTDVKQGLQAVLDGDAYAFVGSMATISHVMGREGIAGLHVAGETPYSFDLSIGVSKDEPILVGLMQKALDVIPEGKRVEIYNRWIAVRYERGFDYSLIWKALIPIVIVFILLLLWNWQLNRVVNRKTTQLRESEAQYRTLVESVQNYYFFYAHDTDGIFTYISPSIEIVLGYRPDEFLTHYSEYLTDDPVNKRMERYTQRALKGEQQSPYELEIYHKNGTRYWIEVNESPVLDDKGNVVSVEGVARNITERKRAENELNEYHVHLQELVEERTADLSHSEERFRALVSNSPGAVYRCLNDPDWTITYISEAIQRISGYPAEGFIDNSVRSYTSIIHPEDTQLVDKKVQAAVDERRTYELTYRIVATDGEVRWVDDRGSAFYTNEGEVKWLEGIIINVTERREAEEKLKQSMDDLERFNRLAVGREKQIISLKQEINGLLQKLGQEPKFKSVE